MRKWKNLLATFTLLLSVGIAFVPATGVSAVDIISQGCKGNGSSTVCQSKGDDAASMMGIIVNTMFVVLGMIAVVMIVIGGIRYATSGGDASSIKSAKETILYSVVGLVVAIMAYTIVNFVLNWF